MTNTTTHEAVARWLLAATLDDAKVLLQDHCETAYRHPYGFDVCRTNLDTLPGWTIRVHLWPQRTELSSRMRETGTEHQGIHCHGWNLQTKVLLGAIYEETFRVKEAGETGDWDLFRVSGTRLVGDNMLELQASGVAVERTQTFLRTPGSGVTSIPKGEFHTSVSADVATVTVVAVEQQSEDSFVAMRTRHGRELAVNERRPVENLVNVLENILTSNA